MSMENPCPLTELLDFTVDDIVIQLPASIRQPLPFVEDSNSKALGEDQELCGARLYEIISSDKDKLTLEGSDLVIDDPTNLALNTDYEITIQVSLIDYPQIDSVSATFKITRQPCELERLTIPNAVTMDPIKMLYLIGTGKKDKTFEDFVQVPACGYDLEY